MANSEQVKAQVLESMKQLSSKELDEIYSTAYTMKQAAAHEESEKRQQEEQEEYNKEARRVAKFKSFATLKSMLDELGDELPKINRKEIVLDLMVPVRIKAKFDFNSYTNNVAELIENMACSTSEKNLDWNQWAHLEQFEAWVEGKRNVQLTREQVETLNDGLDNVMNNLCHDGKMRAMGNVPEVLELAKKLNSALRRYWQIFGERELDLKDVLALSEQK